MRTGLTKLFPAENAAWAEIRVDETQSPAQVYPQGPHPAPKHPPTLAGSFGPLPTLTASLNTTDPTHGQNLNPAETSPATDPGHSYIAALNTCPIQQCQNRAILT